MDDFAIGDSVQSKRGGAVMTIHSFAAETGHLQCIWYVAGILRVGTFYPPNMNKIIGVDVVI